MQGGCNSEHRKCLLSALTAVHIRLVSFRKNVLSYGQDKQNCLLYNDWQSVLQCNWVSPKDCSLYYWIVYSDWQWPMFYSPSVHFPWNTSCLPPSPPPPSIKNRKVNCITSVLISPGYYHSPKRNWKQCLYKVFGGKQGVHVFVHCMVQ